MQLNRELHSEKFALDNRPVVLLKDIWPVEISAHLNKNPGRTTITKMVGRSDLQRGVRPLWMVQNHLGLSKNFWARPKNALRWSKTSWLIPDHLTNLRSSWLVQDYLGLPKTILVGPRPLSLSKNFWPDHGLMARPTKMSFTGQRPVGWS